MKKTILLLGSLFLAGTVFSQNGEEPRWEKGVYALKMSPNGKWLGSMAGNASIYNTEDGTNIYHNESFLGLGNAVANNGWAVGDANDVGVLMIDGETIFPESLSKYWFCDIHSITPDATRICGIVNSIGGGDLMYVPFVAELDEKGRVLEPVILPHPKKDFFRSTPQYVTAVHMSDNGKLIVGQVQDWRGMYSYPIYFVEDNNGEWSYNLPTESMFNPTGIELPDNPWLGEPPFPEPENFMSGLRKEKYLEDFEFYATGGGPYPNPADYMTDEQYEEYAQAVESYNEWYYGQEDSIRKYIQIYGQVLKTSPSFGANDMAIHGAGDYFLMNGERETDDPDVLVGAIYKFYADGTYETIDAPRGGYYPLQCLPDGTITLTKGQAAVPNTLIMLPGSNEFISVQDYYRESNPQISEWLDTKLPGGTGVVLFSDDMKYATGALTPYQLADYDWEFSDFYYSTYFIGYDSAGVESIVAEPQDGVYRVYNLQGVKMLETKDASEVNTLPKGLYIVNGKKIQII